MSSTSLCRVCANSFESCAMIRLFDDADGPMALAKIFLQVSGIAVQADDSRLPKSCCMLCKNRLQEVEHLRCLCQESNRKLRKMIGVDLEGGKEISDGVNVIPKLEVNQLSESYSFCNEPVDSSCPSDDEKGLDFEEEKIARNRTAKSNRNVTIQIEEDSLNSENKTECREEHLEPEDSGNRSKNPKKSKIIDSDSRAPKSFGKPKDRRKRVFQCALCGQIFASRYNLKEHESVHNAELLIKCPMCPKEFTRRNNYKRHMVVHKELFKCSECDRSFRNGAALEEHIRAKHRGERPYQCKLCPKTYQTSASLYCHVQAIHKQNLRFKCDICFKFFLTKTILERHMMKHRGIKFSHCPHCDNKYESNNYLKQHIAERHPETMDNLSQCVYCGLGYATDCHYRKHVVKKHPESLGELDEWLKAKRESAKHGPQTNINVK